MTNAEWMIKNDIPFTNITGICHYADEDGRKIVCEVWINLGVERDVKRLLTEKSAAVALKKVLEWLDTEYKEPILDDVERKYLAGVIAPKSIYKNVNYISKISGGNSTDFIHIDVKNGGIEMPYFPKGKMYKGMEYGNPYTLEELGL